MIAKIQKKVKRKETVFSISREYGITEAELIAANPELRGENKIKKGSFLCIPYPSSPSATQQDTPRQEQDTEERLERKEYRQQENQGYQSEPSGSLIDTSALSAIDIFSVLMEDDHTHEYIDPAFRFGRRKKKKRRRRL